MSENAITRSRRCGLKDIYMAKVTKNDENAYTAETPIKFARAINANITDNYSSETIYSEDGTEEVLTLPCKTRGKHKPFNPCRQGLVVRRRKDCHLDISNFNFFVVVAVGLWGGSCSP